MYSLKVSGRGLKLKKESKTQKEKTTWRVGNIKKNSKVFENFFLKHAKKQKKKKTFSKKKSHQLSRHLARLYIKSGV